MSITPSCCEEAKQRDASHPDLYWSLPSEWGNRVKDPGWVWATGGFNDESPHYGGVYVFVQRCPWCGAKLPDEPTAV